MNAPAIIESLKQTADGLRASNEELNRPQENVVSISVCHHTQDAMKRMMQLYLEHHGTQTDDNAGLGELFDECYRRNPAFIQADIAHIDCKDLDARACGEQYCLSVDAVTCCSHVARQLKDVIWSELKIGE
jgi:hypothetical protein